MFDLLIRALVQNSASSLASGIISNLPDRLTHDPEITNPETQAENLMAFRVTHVLYDGMVRALDPEKGWASPNFSLIDTFTDVLKGEGGLVQKLVPLVDLIQSDNPVVIALKGAVKGIFGGDQPAPAPLPSPLPSPADVALPSEAVKK